MAEHEIVPYSAQDAIRLERAENGNVTLSQRHEAADGETHWIEIAARHVPDVIRALQAVIGGGRSDGNG